MSDSLSKQDQDLLNQMKGAGNEPVATPEPKEPAQPQAKPEAAAPGGEETSQPPEQDEGLKKALREERDRRRKAEAARHELEVKHAAERAAIQERLDLLMQASQHAQQAQQPKAPAPVEIPDINTDPVGHIQATLAAQEAARQREMAEVRQHIEKFSKTSEQWQQSAQQQQQMAELDNWGRSQEAEYARDVPDYQPAMQHLLQVRSQELGLLGMTNPAEIQAQIANDVRGMAVMARQRGLNFGELLYNLSKMRGYAPQQQQAAAPQQQAPDQTFARAARGHEMAQTIGSAGSAPRGNTGPQALARMNDREFSAALQKVREGGDIRSLLGA